MMAKAVVFGLWAVLVSSAAVAQADEGDIQPAPKAHREGDIQPAPKVDPVESAYALPPGITLTPKQLEAYQKLRVRTEAALRQALDAVQSASTENDKRQAAAEVRRMRSVIRAEIINILRAAQIEAYREAMRRYQQARERAGQQHRNRNADRNRRRNRNNDARRNRNQERRPDGPRKAAPQKAQANKGGNNKPAGWQNVNKKPAGWQKRS